MEGGPVSHAAEVVREALACFFGGAFVDADGDVKAHNFDDYDSHYFNLDRAARAVVEALQAREEFGFSDDDDEQLVLAGLRLLAEDERRHPGTRQRARTLIGRLTG
jgi:hypothetical protein